MHCKNSFGELILGAEQTCLIYYSTDREDFSQKYADMAVSEILTDVADLLAETEFARPGKLVCNSLSSFFSF